MEENQMISFCLIMAGALLINHWIGFVLVAAGVFYGMAR
jgi:hypothetical protein